ncbi:DinB superfamily protein [Thalassoglobus neptunius]|uniref:DinB superfamily protein n=1 Tax=Thalassoglobus neptunius TaxID=1938619 RepID=A0A5C5WXL3_9PLAN|nr:DinB family protein [Thalassoglobus neptunius]TWT55466.1 DinB superfamily protein [Thalassoglobus neptunius]
MEPVLNAFRFTKSFAHLLAADIDDREMAQIPHPGMNHPAWILGHVALGADLVAKLLGEPTLTDEEWLRVYGPGSTCSEDRSVYPTKSSLLTKLDDVYEAVEKMIAAATPAQLSAPNATPFFPEQFPTTGDLIVHLMTTHASMHLGQLSAWRRCVGKGSVLGV